MTSENNGMYMPVAPAYGYGGGNGGFGFGGADGWWIILLLLICGGWGNGFGGNGFGGNGGGMGGLYPWMNQSNQVSDGFRDQLLNDNITSIRDGVNGISNQLCSGFAGVTASVTGAQNVITQQMYANQIADMQQSFAAQTATAQGFNNLTAQGADLKYTVATEACADRNAISQGIRDVMENCNRNNQAVLDKLCALELDGVKNQLAAAQRENVGLQNQLNMAALRESQTAQNAFIQQGFSNEVDALYNRLNSCPVPTTPVYGRTPIFTCGGQNMGCGCGGNTFVN